LQKESQKLTQTNRLQRELHPTHTRELKNEGAIQLKKQKTMFQMFPRREMMARKSTDFSNIRVKPNSCENIHATT
jgi:hypothetical protein